MRHYRPLRQSYAQMAFCHAFVVDWGNIPQQNLIAHVADYRRVYWEVLSAVGYRTGDFSPTRT